MLICWNQQEGPLMNELTILHLSDLHLKSGEYDRDVVSKAFLDSLAHLKNQVRKPDLIVVTGDIAYSGTEYGKPATEFFDQLLKHAGLAKERLSDHTGNHDVDQAAGKWLRRTLAIRIGIRRLL